MRVQARSRGGRWTLTKKLGTFAGPGEIMRREVVLDPQVSPEEIKRREVELGVKVGLLLLQLFPSGGATDIVFVTLFRIAVVTANVQYTSCCAVGSGHCLNILLFWRQSTAFLVVRIGACLEPSHFSLPPLSSSLIGLLASVDVKQNYFLSQYYYYYY